MTTSPAGKWPKNTINTTKCKNLVTYWSANNIFAEVLGVTHCVDQSMFKLVQMSKFEETRHTVGLWKESNPGCYPFILYGGKLSFFLLLFFSKLIFLYFSFLWLRTQSEAAYAINSTEILNLIQISNKYHSATYVPILQWSLDHGVRVLVVSMAQLTPAGRCCNYTVLGKKINKLSTLEKPWFLKVGMHSEEFFCKPHIYHYIILHYTIDVI